MLQHQEEECYENKKKRDKELTEYRKEAEEKKEFADRVDRRVGSGQCVHRFSIYTILLCCVHRVSLDGYQFSRSLTDSVSFARDIYLQL